MSKWFPRTGRGLLLGLWACNTSLGDLIGTKIYQYITENDNKKWPTAFYWVAALVFFMGFVSLIAIYEEPKDLNFLN